MNTEKNMVKYEIYKTMHEDLSRAMKAGFYYEAIFIEYAIFEDRLSSLLKYAGFSCEKQGRPLKISKKISVVRDNKKFTTKFIRDRLPFTLLDEVREWTEKRNALIHDLANTPYDSEKVREVAEEGERVLKVFKAKSTSVINRLKKEAGMDDRGEKT